MQCGSPRQRSEAAKRCPPATIGGISTLRAALDEWTGDALEGLRDEGVLHREARAWTSCG